MMRTATALQAEPDVDGVTRLLCQLVAEVRALRADLARDRRPASTLSRADRARLARLLPSIDGALGSEAFASRDLACHSAPGCGSCCGVCPRNPSAGCWHAQTAYRSTAGWSSAAASRSTWRCGMWFRFLTD